MSNPIMRQGPHSFPVKSGEQISRWQLVTLNDDGTVSKATAEGSVFGVAGTPGSGYERNYGEMYHGAPSIVPVHTAPATVRVSVDGKASDVKPGTVLYAAAQGKVTATKGSTPAVAIAVEQGARRDVVVRLLTPTIVES
ncbi:hypothetical protein OS127_02895 [Corynebacterium sp. P6129]|uniref:hypothetical protein n=1 Tax=Corynebacterium antarcticum TaxID=2800405 RepID=UPI002260988D|nr:hypothetical protein [Corynebacterium antarcticum]MCX7491477.1 hypothetical protein [Corynebacterium antarcticum]